MIDETNDVQGLNVGAKAPMIIVSDVNGEPLDFESILKSKSGILIDFFRGAF